MSLGLLAGLVVVRTFLGWTLLLEVERRWPWSRQPTAKHLPARPTPAQVRPELASAGGILLPALFAIADAHRTYSHSAFPSVGYVSEHVLPRLAGPTPLSRFGLVLEKRFSSTANPGKALPSKAAGDFREGWSWKQLKAASIFTTNS
jgi:hypothetical protein